MCILHTAYLSPLLDYTLQFSLHQIIIVSPNELAHFTLFDFNHKLIYILFASFKWCERNKITKEWNLFNGCLLWWCFQVFWQCFFLFNPFVEYYSLHSRESRVRCVHFQIFTKQEQIYLVSKARKVRSTKYQVAGHCKTAMQFKQIIILCKMWTNMNTHEYLSTLVSFICHKIYRSEYNKWTSVYYSFHHLLIADLLVYICENETFLNTRSNLSLEQQVNDYIIWIVHFE